MEGERGYPRFQLLLHGISYLMKSHTCSFERQTMQCKCAIDFKIVKFYIDEDFQTFSILFKRETFAIFWPPSFHPPYFITPPRFSQDKLIQEFFL